jgi:16S rRNA (cytidine1402-2'-O)-methyltransferase
LILFEGASRLAASLADMADVLGAREAVVARELTKKFEEARRGSLAELAAHYDSEGPPRGEIVVLVGPPAGDGEPDAGALDAAILAADASRPLKDIAAEIAEKLGLKRRDVYERALELRASQTSDDED